MQKIIKYVQTIINTVFGFILSAISLELLYGRDYFMQVKIINISNEKSAGITILISLIVLFIVNGAIKIYDIKSKG